MSLSGSVPKLVLLCIAHKPLPNTSSKADELTCPQTLAIAFCLRLLPVLQALLAVLSQHVMSRSIATAVGASLSMLNPAHILCLALSFLVLPAIGRLNPSVCNSATAAIQMQWLCETVDMNGWERPIYHWGKGEASGLNVTLVNDHVAVDETAAGDKAGKKAQRKEQAAALALASIRRQGYKLWAQPSYDHLRIT